MLPPAYLEGERLIALLAASTGQNGHDSVAGWVSFMQGWPPATSELAASSQDYFQFGVGMFF